MLKLIQDIAFLTCMEFMQIYKESNEAERNGSLNNLDCSMINNSRIGQRIL